jgi:V/A-type H+-transporting ATPase subunit G/H
MEQPESGGAGEVIERLGEQEALLNRRVEAAREDAREVVRKARAEAERLRDEAKLRLANEVEALRREKTQEVEVAFSALKRETASRIEALRQRARANQERALRFLLLRVTGEETG